MITTNVIYRIFRLKVGLETGTAFTIEGRRREGVPRHRTPYRPFATGECHIEVFRDGAQGRARFFVPDEAYYSGVVAYPGHREVLYEEVLTPGAGYTYRPGPIVTPEEHY